ncbi:PIN domain-containing protein [Halodesulfovibrio sp.]|jgi:rRNA-processing protein FCF1|uniref:PIN domain-containing protein n=1 Tax=Halodesulfovibrio sp. TaxID=1912772 RepID=UPI0025EF9A22|nr:PIN domain-containing protein [Halodesulfovibrio sp.]MCT4628034.1 PIN domain-containing protein [Halodesulfovibrio sp.]
MNVFLDTNILHNDHLSSASLKRLAALSSAGIINLFLPDIVTRELTSNKALEFSNNISSCSKTLKKALKQHHFSDKFLADFQAVKNQLLEIEKIAEKDIETNLTNWIKESKATLIPFEHHFMGSILEHYFKGGGAFGSRKNRKDFPDAMIAATIYSFVEKAGPCSVISNDSNLSKHLKENKEITTYSSIRNYLKQLGTKIEFSGGQKILDYFSSNHTSNQLIKFFKKNTDYFDSIYLENDMISNKRAIEVEADYFEVNSADFNNTEELTVTDLNFINESELGGNISFVTNTGLSYVTGYKECLMLEEYRDITVFSATGSGACEIGESALMKFSGEIIFKLLNRKDEHMIERLNETLTYNEFNEFFTIELEIKTGEILNYL